VRLQIREDGDPVRSYFTKLEAFEHLVNANCHTVAAYEAWYDFNEEQWSWEYRVSINNATGKVHGDSILAQELRKYISGMEALKGLQPIQQ
jgi:hypothetical protein